LSFTFSIADIFNHSIAVLRKYPPFAGTSVSLVST